MAYLLTLVTFVPLVGAILVLLLPRRQEHVTKLATLGTTLVTFAISLPVYFRFDAASADYQFVEQRAWIPSLGVTYHVGVDGISVLLVLLTTFLMPLVLLSSWTSVESRWKEFAITMLLLETGMLGVFVALDLFLFYVFWEAMLIPMYLIIGIWGGPNRVYAAVKFILYTLAGSLLMLVAILFVYFQHGAATNVYTFDLPVLVRFVSPGGLTQDLLFLAFALAFAIKVPMFPFHTWLPDAHTQAPTVGSVILAAILLKLGTYGFIRIAIPILPSAAKEWAPWIGGLAVIGIIYGALCCLAQTDMKRLIAFSSVSHMGFVMLGIATLTSFGFNAAIFGMVAHGLITGMLFFVAGSVKERYHTLEIRRMSGMLKQAPRLGWILGFCAMASLGLPGLAGFWGEFPAILSAYNPVAGLKVETFRVYMVIAAVGTVLAAAYLLWLYQRTSFGEPTPEFAHDGHIHDVEVPEWIAWTPLLVGILVLGVYPNILFKVMSPAVTMALQAYG